MACLAEKHRLATEWQQVIQGSLSYTAFQQDLNVFYQRHGFKHGRTSSAQSLILPITQALERYTWSRFPSKRS